MSRRDLPGDGGAFDEMWQAHHHYLLAYAARRLGSREAAQEAVAEAFATAWLHRRSVPPEPATRLWLTRATFHALRNLARKNERQRVLVKAIVDEQRQPPTPWPDADSDIRDRLRVALVHLSEADRELIRLALWEGLRHSDIGIILDLSANNVAVRLHRLKARLREQLTAYSGETTRAMFPPVREAPADTNTATNGAR